MKVPVDRRRTVLVFVIADLLFAALLFVSCMNLFLFQKWGVVQILIIGLFAVTSVFMLVLSLVRNFYVIESKYLVVVKAFKETVYNYADVVYIDNEQSEKKRVLTFYTRFGHARYLSFDKHGEIYTTFLKKCRNVLDKDQFKEKYPNVKL